MTDAVYIFQSSENNKKELSRKAYEFVKDVFKKEYGQKNDVVFTVTSKGKPYIKGYPRFNFNISHSGIFLAVAISNRPVGVDIEVIRDVNLKIAQRRFAENEKLFVKDRDSFFYVWTRKESLTKRDGKSIYENISTIDVLQRNDIKTEKRNNYILSVCSENIDDFVIIV